MLWLWLPNIFDLHSFAINKYRVKKDQMFQIRKTNKIYDWSRLTLVHHEYLVLKIITGLTAITSLSKSMNNLLGTSLVYQTLDS